MSTQRQTQQGFGLVEILIGLVIIGAGLILVGNFQGTKLKESSHASQRAEAVTLAEKMLESEQNIATLDEFNAAAQKQSIETLTPIQSKTTLFSRKIMRSILPSGEIEIASIVTWPDLIDPVYDSSGHALATENTSVKLTSLVSLNLERVVTTVLNAPNVPTVTTSSGHHHH